MEDFEDSPSIKIGTSADGISLAVLGRLHPTCNDYWDGNWITTAIEVSVGAFRGKVMADLRTEELAAFHIQLCEMAASLSGRADFDTMEGWLKLEMQIDRLGHIAVSGAVRDEPGVGNTLKFDLAIDQTYLRGIISSLDSVLAKFPVIGNP